MQWFRVELDADGAVRRCERVASEGESGIRILFVRAADEASARRQASAMHMRIRRVEYKQRGLCTCGNPRLPGKLRCAVCKRRDDRYNLKKAGKPVPFELQERLPSGPKPAADRRNEEKRELLIEVREQFLRLNVRPFGEWLNSQIDALTERPAPKLRVVGK